MFGLMDRITGGVDPMLRDLESYIIQNGLDDMRACADIITTVRRAEMQIAFRTKWPKDV